jgi:catechol-2,3-dioxygenase
MKINTLTLQTNQIGALRAFYAEVLGLLVVDASETQCSFQVGGSVLRFQDFGIPAYYHFAFNISSGSIAEAKTWLEQRVPLLHDEELQNTIIDFSAWNAKAIYFQDPAGNIVELIARDDINTPLEGSFSEQSLLSISEVGLSVADVQASFQQLHAQTGLPLYSGTGPTFCAAGDPEGLFILVDEKEKAWYPTEVPAQGFPVVATVDIAGQSFTIERFERCRRGELAFIGSS